MLYLLLITTIFSSDSAETMKKKRFHLETNSNVLFTRTNANSTISTEMIKCMRKKVVSSAEHA